MTPFGDLGRVVRYYDCFLRDALARSGVDL